MKMTKVWLFDSQKTYDCQIFGPDSLTHKKHMTAKFLVRKGEKLKLSLNNVCRILLSFLKNRYFCRVIGIDILDLMITAVDSTLVQKEEFWLSYERPKSRPSENSPTDFCTILVLLKALKINFLYSKIAENFTGLNLNANLESHWSHCVLYWWWFAQSTATGFTWFTDSVGMIIPVTSRKFDAITRATVVPNSVTKDEKECSGCGCCEHLYLC